MPPEEDTAVSEDTEVSTETEVTPDAETGAPTAEDEQSLTTETGENQEEVQEEPQEEDVEITPERFQELMRENEELKNRVSGSTKAFQEHQQNMAEAQAERDALRQEVEAIRKANEQKAMAVFDPANPASKEFYAKLPAIEGLRNYHQQIRGKVEEDQIPAAVEAFAASMGVSEKDISDYRAYEVWQKQESLAWADPKQRAEKIQDLIDSRVNSILTNRNETAELQTYYEGMLNSYDAELKDSNGNVRADRQQKLMQAIDQGHNPEPLLMQFRIDDLNQRLGTTASKAERAEANASAKAKASKGRAKESRDQVVDRKFSATEIWKEANKTWEAKHGTKPDRNSKVWLQHYQEIERQFHKSNNA